MGWHLIPDHEHQTGSWKLGLEKLGVGSQSLKVERGSLSEDLRERREMSCKGREEEEEEEAERTRDIWRKKMKKKKKKVRKKGKESFMVFGGVLG